MPELHWDTPAAGAPPKTFTEHVLARKKAESLTPFTTEAVSRIPYAGPWLSGAVPQDWTDVALLGAMGPVARYLPIKPGMGFLARQGMRALRTGAMSGVGALTGAATKEGAGAGAAKGGVAQLGGETIGKGIELGSRFGGKALAKIDAQRIAKEIGDLIAPLKVALGTSPTAQRFHDLFVGTAGRQVASDEYSRIIEKELIPMTAPHRIVVPSIAEALGMPTDHPLPVSVVVQAYKDLNTNPTKLLGLRQLQGNVRENATAYRRMAKEDIVKALDHLPIVGKAAARAFNDANSRYAEIMGLVDTFESKGVFRKGGIDTKRMQDVVAGPESEGGLKTSLQERFGPNRYERLRSTIFRGAPSLTRDVVGKESGGGLSVHPGSATPRVWLHLPHAPKYAGDVTVPPLRFGLGGTQRYRLGGMEPSPGAAATLELTNVLRGTPKEEE